MTTVVEQILRDQGRMKSWLAAQVRVTPAGLWYMLHSERPTYFRVCQIAQFLGVKPDAIADHQGKWRRADKTEAVDAG